MKTGISTLCILFLTGCAFVSDKVETERLDPDGDGVFWPTDCDDNNPEIGGFVWYKDQDSDGYGDQNEVSNACSAEEGWVENGGDCDDSNPAINPDTIWYADADGDATGNPNVTQTSCDRPNGFVSNANDCNDNDASIYLGNAIYEDQEGCYQDSDGDGYGSIIASCCYEIKMTDLVQENGWNGAILEMDIQDYVSFYDDYFSDFKRYLTLPNGGEKTRQICIQNGQKLVFNYKQGFEDQDNALRITKLNNGETTDIPQGLLNSETALSLTQECIMNSTVDMGSDCDDGHPFVYPGAPELCDGYNNSCAFNQDGDNDLTMTFEDKNGTLIGFTKEVSDVVRVSDVEGIDVSAIHFCNSNFNVDLQFEPNKKIAIHGYGGASLRAVQPQQHLINGDNTEITIVNIDHDLSNVDYDAIKIENNGRLAMYEGRLENAQNPNLAGIAAYNASRVKLESVSIDSIGPIYSGLFADDLNDENTTERGVSLKNVSISGAGSETGIYLINSEVSMDNVTLEQNETDIKTEFQESWVGLKHTSYLTSAPVTADCIEQGGAIYCGSWETVHIKDTGNAAVESIDNYHYSSVIFDVESTVTLDRINLNVTTGSEDCTVQVGIYKYTAGSWELLNSQDMVFSPGDTFSETDLLLHGDHVGLIFEQNSQMGIIAHFLDCPTGQMNTINVNPSNTAFNHLTLVDEQELGVGTPNPTGFPCNIAGGSNMITKGNYCILQASEYSLIDSTAFGVFTFNRVDEILDMLFGISHF